MVAKVFKKSGAAARHRLKSRLLSTASSHLSTSRVARTTRAPSLSSSSTHAPKNGGSGGGDGGGDCDGGGSC
jgi:hypothetical protein